MRHYEATLVLDPELQEDGYNKQLERIMKFIEDRGGSLVRDDRWGIRTLAYKIKKQTQGFYGVLEWEGPGELITELDHMLRLDEHILRHLVIHLDPTILAAQEEQRRRRVVKAEAGEDRVPALLDKDEEAEKGKDEEAEKGKDEEAEKGEDRDEHKNEDEEDKEHEHEGSQVQDDEGRVEP